MGPQPSCVILPAHAAAYSPQQGLAASTKCCGSPDISSSSFFSFNWSKGQASGLELYGAGVIPTIRALFWSPYNKKDHSTFGSNFAFGNSHVGSECRARAMSYFVMFEGTFTLSGTLGRSPLPCTTKDCYRYCRSLVCLCPYQGTVCKGTDPSRTYVLATKGAGPIMGCRARTVESSFSLKRYHQGPWELLWGLYADY